jgi:hypothetical protein
MERETQLYFPFENGNDSDAAPTWISYGLIETLPHKKRGNKSFRRGKIPKTTLPYFDPLGGNGSAAVII